MSEMASYTDVVELCALLQCLGFTVKSLDTNDGNSEDAGARTVVINCQTSGLNVVLECAGTCTCPVPSEQNSGFWQVSGMAGGKLFDKESGSGLLGSLPKAYRERLTKELSDMVRCIKEVNESVERPREANNSVERPREGNKSASMIEMNTPEKRYLLQLKADTPTRYRSLDTLTSLKDEATPLPAPGALEKQVSETADIGNAQKKIMCRRQSTYTISSTPGSVRYKRNKTSSPIHGTQNTVLETLVAAENTVEELRKKLSFVIRELLDEERNNSSVSSLALDVSKISILKGAETSKAQFASSPNLSGLGTLHEELTKSKLKRFDSASTSNLSPITTADKSKTSRLRRLSPSMFKLKKEVTSKTQDGKSKLQSLFKPKIVTPARSPRTGVEPSPNLSAKKKFSHVKSTIPRPTAKKE